MAEKKELVYVDTDLVSAAATKLSEIGKKLSGVLGTCQIVLDQNWNAEGGDQYGRQFAENFQPNVKDSLANVNELRIACEKMGINLKDVVTAYRELDALGGRALEFEDK